MGKTKSLISFNTTLHKKSDSNINFEVFNTKFQIKEIVKKFKKQKSMIRDVPNSLEINPVTFKSTIFFEKRLSQKMNEETPKKISFCDQKSKFLMNNKETQTFFFSAESNLNNKSERFLNNELEAAKTPKQKKDDFTQPKYNFKIQINSLNEDAKDDAKNNSNFSITERHSNNSKIQSFYDTNFLKIPERKSYNSYSPLAYLQTTKIQQPFDLAKTLKHFRNKSIDLENKIKNYDKININNKIEGDPDKNGQQLKEMLKSYGNNFNFDFKPNREGLKEKQVTKKKV